MAKKTTEQFINEAKQVHGDKYDYSLVEYINVKTNITILCSIHGEFDQNPYNHLRGSNCPKCVGKGQRTKSDFVEKSKQVHGDKYDYSLVSYKNNSTKVTILCPEHGKFEQTPDCHTQGQGCPKCGIKKSSESRKLQKSVFTKRSKGFHNNKYDYSLVGDYNTSHDKVTIICPEHGEFEQQVYVHLNGHGCPKCKAIKHVEESVYSINEFIQKAREVHGNKYDYSLVDYNRAHDYISLKCPNHGIYIKKAYMHLQGQGCPKCSVRNSNGENEILQFIENFNANIECNNRILINPYELDIVIPDKELAIEYNGLYWHSEVYRDKNYHKMKTELAEQQGYQLIHIFEDEWLEKQELVKRMLKHKLGVDDSPKVYARKCSVKNISFNEHKYFMEQNHIQGSNNASIRLGLYYNNELVACLSFKKLSDGNYDLVRYATSCNVVGGFSKLLKVFQKAYDWKSIITFANRRYSMGELYLNNGFTFLYNTNPNYYYIKATTRVSRNEFQKHKLKNKLKNYDENLSEHKNMINNGYYRIYDCGHMKFELNNE